MVRRIVPLFTIIAIVVASLVVTAAPAVSAGGDHAAMFSSGTGAVMLRSSDTSPTTFTVFVRAAPNLYLPARTGVMVPGACLMMPVPSAAPGYGPLYVVNFFSGGSVSIFQPEEWGWDF